MKSIKARKSDNAIMSGEYVVMKARSWRQAEKILGLVSQSFEAGRDDAMAYGDSYNVFLAHKLGVSPDKLAEVLLESKLALAKKV